MTSSKVFDLPTSVQYLDLFCPPHSPRVSYVQATVKNKRERVGAISYWAERGGGGLKLLMLLIDRY